ncbi:hypothetical protein ACLB1T_21945 [Escherichia coli]
MRLHRANSHAPEAVVEGASRAMRISMNRELEIWKRTFRSSVRLAPSARILVCLVRSGGSCTGFIALGAVKQATLQKWLRPVSQKR